eukprot:5808272-Alexandrium_andersonii.AAC.1
MEALYGPEWRSDLGETREARQLEVAEDQELRDNAAWLPCVPLGRRRQARRRKQSVAFALRAPRVP